MKNDLWNWNGYEFRYWPIYQPLDNLPEFSGVYIFSLFYQVDYADHGHYAVYIGQSKDVVDRLQYHKRNHPILLRSSHIHARIVKGGELARSEVEENLIGHYNPPRNIDHRTDQAESIMTYKFGDAWLKIPPSWMEVDALYPT